MPMNGLQEINQQFTGEEVNLFPNLCIRKTVDTGKLSIINVIITYDSKHAVCLCIDKRLIHG